MSDDIDRAAVLNRVKRAQGQLGGVLRMIEEGRELEAVLGQMKAVSRALDRAGLAMVAAEWRAGADVGDVTPERIDRLERLFLSVT
ncbi:metal-sensitive transcriptional regulator [Nocardioides dongxiaopingii]|uniref:metal-sensitive transcriptional regulator n=1 Tax=Nocardioides TaxID=1839 RepID=UPI0010C76572|nr:MULTISPECIES: metal-sensitive transcriptional regulator [Nocardioides]QCW51552.1 metal-sensitive transcriptional regulator [Nocardioides sp. S-1144]